MHRLASRPGSHDPAEQGLLIEQPPAAVLLLSSADSDLLALAALQRSRPQLLQAEMRCLNLAALGSPAVIDHYIASTAAAARLVVIRLLGGRGHWSYGLEQFQNWVQQRRGRQLVVLAGTADEDASLSELSSVDSDWACALARCWREGGARA